MSQGQGQAFQKVTRSKKDNSLQIATDYAKRGEYQDQKKNKVFPYSTVSVDLDSARALCQEIASLAQAGHTKITLSLFFNDAFSQKTNKFFDRCSLKVSPYVPKSTANPKTNTYAPVAQDEQAMAQVMGSGTGTPAPGVGF